MAEQIPLTIHPGWYWAASIISLAILYMLCGAATQAYCERREKWKHEDWNPLPFLFWPVFVLFGWILWYPFLWAWMLGEWLAKSCEPKPPEDTSK